MQRLAAVISTPMSAWPTTCTDSTHTSGHWIIHSSRVEHGAAAARACTTTCCHTDAAVGSIDESALQRALSIPSRSNCLVELLLGMHRRYSNTTEVPQSMPTRLVWRLHVDFDAEVVRRRSHVAWKPEVAPGAKCLHATAAAAIAASRIAAAKAEAIDSQVYTKEDNCRQQQQEGPEQPADAAQNHLQQDGEQAALSFCSGSSSPSRL